MFIVLLVLIGTGLVLSQESCPSICRHVYNHPDWKLKDRGFFDEHIDGGSLGSGIVTAEYHMNDDGHSGSLKFIAGVSINKPLTITFKTSSITFNGELDGLLQDSKEIQFPPGNFFQISDDDPNHYLIICGDSDRKQKIEYNYDSESIWKDFQDNKARLRDTVKVRNSDGSAVFKYISICQDAVPRLCGEQTPTVIEAKLGESYTLICSAAGAPFLTSSWTKDGVFTSSSTVTVDTDKPDHKITSTIEITSFSVDEIGRWECTISNKNFGKSVTKIYEVRYSEEVILAQAPTEDFYTSGKGKTMTFDWKVTGWPLDKVSFNCHTIKKSQISTDTTGYLTTNPPSVDFRVTLQDEDQVLCTIKHEDQVLGTTNITRVGLGCVVGEKGVGKDCVVCPLGQTSDPGSATCYPTQSVCQEGFYGIGVNCTLCPVGESSPVGSVKVQECLKIAHKSGVSVGLVVGASVAGAIVAAGLVFLVPKLVKMYRATESGNEETGEGKGANDMKKNKAGSAQKNKAKKETKRKEDKLKKTKADNPDDMMAYKDEAQMFYYAGEASEAAAPPPLPPKSVQASKELKRRKSNQHRNRNRKPRQKKGDEKEQAYDTTVIRKVPTIDYIDNTIIPPVEHYYEDLDRLGESDSSEWSD